MHESFPQIHTMPYHLWGKIRRTHLNDSWRPAIRRNPQGQISEKQPSNEDPHWPVGMRVGNLAPVRPGSRQPLYPCILRGVIIRN